MTPPRKPPPARVGAKPKPRPKAPAGGKRKKVPSDETLLRTAKASATRQANRLQRQRRAEQTLRDLGDV